MPVTVKISGLHAGFTGEHRGEGCCCFCKMSPSVIDVQTVLQRQVFFLVIFIAAAGYIQIKVFIPVSVEKNRRRIRAEAVVVKYGAVCPEAAVLLLYKEAARMFL